MSETLGLKLIAFGFQLTVIGGILEIPIPFIVVGVLLSLLGFLRDRLRQLETTTA
ncbi:hypothetical protein [Natrinema salaciae]|uniref:Uncharacterized protein n=1 Tax=Natrinema salaciae TaxID=1186196 RepID=A0A1H9Q6M0_9EURY|nr:hypothetical protein [Natrinema salaciae]SER56068.1 hypothetical protein SAMN04489841_4100 [Natrinema salaciae]